MPRVLIVQVSDLHFSAGFFPAGGPIAARTPGSRVHPPMPGLQPHDPNACDRLVNRVDRLRRSLCPDQCVIAVTGDLTVNGSDSEFVQALTFLQGKVESTWLDFVGLGGHYDRVSAVPGNHDHLAGQLFRTPVRPHPVHAVHDKYMPSAPGGATCWWTHDVLDLDGLRLQVGGLDSCGKGSQLFAQGNLDPVALQELGDSFDTGSADAQQSGRRSVNVVLLHHSLAYKGSVRAWLHQLPSDAQQDLRSFCLSHKVHFLLTGHVHSPHVPGPGSQHRMGTELRCGTTLQRSGAHNSFLAHLIEEDAGKVRWTTGIYRRSAGGEFIERRSQTYSTAL